MRHKEFQNHKINAIKKSFELFSELTTRDIDYMQVIRTKKEKLINDISSQKFESSECNIVF